MVSGSELFSLLDGFSGYNQVLVVEEDMLKMTFKTKWGTFAYRRMPFGLINVGATFQRAMDIAFRGLIGRSVVVYLDDVTIFSKDRRACISFETDFRALPEIWHFIKSQEMCVCSHRRKATGSCHFE